ncbi:MAG: hypothetical protein AABW51_05420 [Nanoarchaeota archaeon]
MKKLFVIMTLLILSLSLVLANNSGAIWTTKNDCGNQTQNVNQYAKGEKVYINGNNFEPGNYEWSITGLNGGASCDPNTKVINGTYGVGDSKKFCFEAYTVNLDDCGEYKASFGGKKDNYRVDLDAPVVPEFGVIIGGLTILSAIGVFFMVRRR